MTPLAVVLVTVLAVALVYGVWRWARHGRRVAAVAQPFETAWRVRLERDVPLYRRLPADLRARLERPAQHLLHTVEFIGCDGLVVDEHMQRVIAVQAALLVAERDPHEYDGLYSVLVYPDEFVVQEVDEDESGIVTEGERALSGQTIATDRIVLSWRDVLAAGREDEIYNVVLHEFAHYLDHAHEGRNVDAAFHDVLRREYDALCEALDRDEETLIDPYGAEEPAEFFAVATETFFEAPHELRAWHPALYEALRSFYRLSPADWPTDPPNPGAP